MAKAQAQEPSMEEILASIRRIIADEDAGPAAVTKIAAVAAKPQPAVAVSEDELDKLFAADDDDDVLDLDESDKISDEVHIEDDDLDLAFEPAPKPVAKPAPAPQPVKVAAPAPAPRAEPVRQPERRRPDPEPAYDTRMADAPVDPLISEATDSMVSAAFDNLSLTILNKNARTVEDLIQDMLRPMLRSWLDKNLPSLVERLVKAEIERVARGR